jgi:zinc-finger of acetyl-transferase ESCO
MSNNIKRAIKARKQKLGERHSTARMNIVGSDGGGGHPPESGLVKCAACGLSYVTDVPEDIRMHEARHRAMDAAATPGIVVEMNHGELEHRKSEAWRTLSAATTNAQRLEAMDAVCRCH